MLKIIIFVVMVGLNMFSHAYDSVGDIDPRILEKAYKGLILSEVPTARLVADGFYKDIEEAERKKAALREFLEKNGLNTIDYKQIPLRNDGGEVITSLDLTNLAPLDQDSYDAARSTYKTLKEGYSETMAGFSKVFYLASIDSKLKLFFTTMLHMQNRNRFGIKKLKNDLVNTSSNVQTLKGLRKVSSISPADKILAQEVIVQLERDIDNLVDNKTHRKEINSYDKIIEEKLKQVSPEAHKIVGEQWKEELRKMFPQDPNSESSEESSVSEEAAGDSE